MVKYQTVCESELFDYQKLLSPEKNRLFVNQFIKVHVHFIMNLRNIIRWKKCFLPSTKAYLNQSEEWIFRSCVGSSKNKVKKLGALESQLIFKSMGNSPETMKKHFHYCDANGNICTLGS